MCNRQQLQTLNSCYQKAMYNYSDMKINLLAVTDTPYDNNIWCYCGSYLSPALSRLADAMLEYWLVELEVPYDRVMVFNSKWMNACYYGGDMSPYAGTGICTIDYMVWACIMYATVKDYKKSAKLVKDAGIGGAAEIVDLFNSLQLDIKVSKARLTYLDKFLSE